MNETVGGWRTDFDAPDIRDHPLVVYATDDDGYGYGLAAWSQEKDGSAVLVWMHPPYGPVNDGIERGLCWKPIDYPGVEFLDGLAHPLTPKDTKTHGE